MKVSLNWVKQYTDVDLPVDELVEKIGAQLGAVEEVIDLGAKYRGIIIAKVVSCEKHPNADKLSVCLIDDGGKAKKVERNKDGFVQVVCGAPNVREGLLVAWLPPGSTVPSSVDKEPFVLEARELRGVMSNGMLASASELAISDDHSGIVELNAHDGKPGDNFAEAYKLNDHIINIENKMFTHRPDLFGQLGVAREIAGITGKKFTSPAIYSSKQKTPGNGSLKLEVVNKAGDVVQRFVAQVYEDVDVWSQFVWLQTYLSRVGIRPINNVVDITNYYMMLTSQPLHAYDYDKLLKVSGKKSASLESRMSKKGEKLKLLNGKEITFEDDSTILITSGDVPVGIAGVMGGADTEVDENTKNIVLECATFDMYNIRKTSMKYGLFTDAVTRFNKGQSPLQNNAVVGWASQLIINLTGGKPGMICDIGNPKQQTIVRVNKQFVNERLGLDLEADAMEKLLTNVEFTLERSDNTDELQVTPPFWRTDIEIPEDLVEEIGRLHGFDHLPLELPKRSVSPPPKDYMLDLKQTIREVLAKAGANEVLTYSFVHGNLLEKVGQDTKKAYKLSNALSPDLQYYRISLMPSLLDKVHMNIKTGYGEFALFELNKSHIKGENDPLDPKVPKEFTTLALVVARSDKLKGQPGYYQARNYLDHLAAQFGMPLHYEPLTEAPTYPAAAPFDYKRSARVYVGDKIIGLVGEFKPAVRKALKLPAATAGFEISVKFELFSRLSKYTPLSRYPNVEQDISLKVAAGTAYQKLFEVLSKELLNQENALTQLTPLDIFQREDDPKHVQMSFRFRIAHYEKTLKSEEVNAMLDAAAKVAKETLHAQRI